MCAKDLTEYQRDLAKVLLALVKDEKYSITYKELAKQAGRPKAWRMGKSLYWISNWCNDEGLPLITLIVKSSINNQPENGVFKMLEEFRGKIDRKKIIREETDKIEDWDDWSALEDYLQIQV